MLAVVFASGEFEALVQERGWTFDAWIQSAMNAYIAAGRTDNEFTSLVEEVLYAPLRRTPERKESKTSYS